MSKWTEFWYKSMPPLRDAIGSYVDGFDDFLKDFGPLDEPRMEIKEDCILISADMPGVPKEKVTVELNGHDLKIVGRREETLTYTARITLPDDYALSTADAEATVRDGVVTVYIPYKNPDNASSAKTIPVN